MLWPVAALPPRRRWYSAEDRSVGVLLLKGMGGTGCAASGLQRVVGCRLLCIKTLYLRFSLLRISSRFGVAEFGEGCGALPASVQHRSPRLPAPWGRAKQLESP